MSRTPVVTTQSLPNPCQPTYLSMQQLRLGTPTAFNLIPDTAEERNAILFLVEMAEFIKDLASLLCKGKKNNNKKDVKTTTTRRQQQEGVTLGGEGGRKEKQNQLLATKQGFSFRCFSSLNIALDKDLSPHRSFQQKWHSRHLGQQSKS